MLYSLIALGLSLVSPVEKNEKYFDSFGTVENLESFSVVPPSGSGGVFALSEGVGEDYILPSSGLELSLIEIPAIINPVTSNIVVAVHEFDPIVGLGRLIATSNAVTLNNKYAAFFNGEVLPRHIMVVIYSDNPLIASWKATLGDINSAPGTWWNLNDKGWTTGCAFGVTLGVKILFGQPF